MIDLVTISRQYGSGGGELARQLQALLGWPVFDENLACLVADRLRLDGEVIREMDEVPPSLLARMVSTLLLIKPPELLHPVDTSDLLSPDGVALMVREILIESAASPPVIIVGHGSQCLFQRRPATLHVRTGAPIATRVAYLASRSPKAKSQDLAAIAQRMDSARAEYVRRYYRADWQDPLLYDLQFNTARVTVPVAARLVAAVVADHAAKSPGSVTHLA